MLPDSEDLAIGSVSDEDLAEIYRIERQSFTSPWSLEHFRHCLEDRSILFLGARQAGHLVGYVIAAMRFNECLIANLAVLPEHRRRGIAGRLIETTLHRCRLNGAQTAVLDVRESNRAGIELYEKLGFEVVGKRFDYYQSPTEDSLVMSRVL